MSNRVLTAGILSAAIVAACVAQADVFSMPGGETSMQFVGVGNVGNAADATGYGSVGYAYQMGTFDVTVGQYVDFLNAVASTDTYGLYNSAMISGDGVFPFGITQSSISGSYSYSVTGSFSPFMLAAVPEPSTFVLLGVGSAGLLAFAWRKRRASQGRRRMA
jgi:hypothetical protein